MSDLTPLLREAADALWLIPQHAGLAQRLQHAAERTRPSEAELQAMPEFRAVYDAMNTLCREAAGVEERSHSAILIFDMAMEKFAAALSTPPLPSAEPPSVTVAKALMGDTWLAHRMDTPEKLRDHYVEYGRQSTPPAAAQDTTRLDWPVGEMEPAIESCYKRVKDDEDPSGIWLDTLRSHALTATWEAERLDAARAAGGE